MKPDKTNAILIGAALVAVTSTSYLSIVNVLCCAGVIGGGVLAVFRYTTDNRLTITGGEGAKLGFMAALIGAVIALVLTFVLRSIGIRDDLAISNFMIDRFGDQMQPAQLDAMDAQMSQPVWKTMLSFTTLLGPVISGALGAVGGLIGASVFKKGGDLRPEQTY